MRQRIEVDEIAPGLNGSDGLIREHYQAKKRRQERYQWLIRQQRPKKHKGKVRLTYIRKCVRKMDWDNLAASFKHWGDALTALEIIKDDNPDVIVDFRPKWEKAKGYKTQATIIEIEDV